MAGTQDTLYGKIVRLLADVNIEAEAVALLRSFGHDVLWAKESSPESPDINLFADRLHRNNALCSLTMGTLVSWCAGTGNRLHSA